MSSKKPLTKKAKQRAKNKKEFIRRMLVEEQLRKVDIAAPEYEPPEPQPKSKQEQEQEIWSAKLQQIRNKTTGRRRAAKDRWNRFAGTASSAGGRGR